VFTFHTERGSTDLSRVTIEITPQGTGCELTLTHEMDPKWAAYKDRTQAGWTMILANFAAVLGSPH
jgi:Activator of Hsp90 ATPase homolog 1-like protein